MAITYISSIERPDDNDTFGGSVNCSLLLDAVGASTGDLVIVVGQYRGATTIEVNETGGQTWNSLTQIIDAASLCQVRYFWCRWSDENSNGNNPNFFANGTSGNPFTCVGHIFRPTSSSNLWAINNAQSFIQFTTPGSPFTVTQTGVTTTQASTVTIASWHTADANTWGSLSGTGWSVLGTAQYRNLTGSAQSSSYAYKIQTTTSATGSVSKNQATNGGDPGVSSIISFYEFAATTPIAGSSIGSSTVSANIKGKATIASNSSGSATGSSTLTGKGRMSATVNGTGTAVASLNAKARIAGTSTGLATSNLILSAKAFITGISIGASTATITIGAADAITISFYSPIEKILSASSIINRTIQLLSPINPFL